MLGCLHGPERLAVPSDPRALQTRYHVGESSARKESLVKCELYVMHICLENTFVSSWFKLGDGLATHLGDMEI